MADEDLGYDLPDDWPDIERELYDDIVHGDPIIGEDRGLQMLFDEAMFDMELPPWDRDAVYEAMLDYLWDEYGIDFEMDFDWEAYREWYDS